MDYLVTTRDGKVSISVIDDEGNVLETVTPAHVNFKEVYRRVKDGDTADDDLMRELVKPVDKIADLLSEVSDKFTYEDGQLSFEGAPVLDMFANQLVRVLREASDTTDEKKRTYVTAVAKFGEKLMGNTSHRCRNELFNFVSNGDMTITEDGDFIAYKGVVKKEEKDDDGNVTEKFVSVHSGPANLVAIDGVLQPEGQVENPLGAEITMDRRHINDDHSVGCSQGLHVGYFDYAKGFGQGGLLMCAVDPADVVTVPKDCSFQKLRVSKYRTLEVTEYEYKGAVYTPGCGSSKTYCTDEDCCPNCGSDAEACDDCDGCCDCCDC